MTRARLVDVALAVVVITLVVLDRVAGFDDTPSARVVWPQLTTIRQPNAEMAAEAVDLAIGRPDLLAQDAPERSLAFRLMVRESTGPAPARGSR